MMKKQINKTIGTQVTARLTAIGPKSRFLESLDFSTIELAPTMIIANSHSKLTHKLFKVNKYSR
ncbi:hypothetical protein VS_2007 [Vibrio atlanticus]|uniref:Uncharacterized protein n=1 Tax=Vibrio atlanticus (strain LGP32) TaxID=575788 RepID=B7VGY4_VIBA3|nr:hypothetical protein VS_2007 [Vibrio atlanticus]